MLKILWSVPVSMGTDKSVLDPEPYVENPILFYVRRVNLPAIRTRRHSGASGPGPNPQPYPRVGRAGFRGTRLKYCGGGGTKRAFALARKNERNPDSVGIFYKGWSTDGWKAKSEADKKNRATLVDGNVSNTLAALKKKLARELTSVEVFKETHCKKIISEDGTTSYGEFVYPKAAITLVFSHLQGAAEDLSSLRQPMISSLLRYIVISCIDVDLIWRSDKVSFVYYTILRKGLYHPLCRSTLQAKTPQDKRYILYLAEDPCPSFAQQVSHAFNA
ncbi:hypothetical protein L6452_08746 [Arctium lappa]|uniref:Uncharacterized protein n=1 Tax=Arctium lappa TaxID=4217 RepID=A0ACB9DI26_ARCLA|nr:hypothetical protein L6452_08746 [Arctium lappa]